MGTKVQVQIRYCFCFSITVAAALIAVYAILLYLLFVVLASVSLARPDPPHAHDYYEECRRAALEPGKCHFGTTVGAVTVDNKVAVICDASSYHCSLGLYTEELKFDKNPRVPFLWFNLLLYAVIVLAAIVLLIGLCVDSQWLLLPWVALVIVDIVRGFISCIFIFIKCHGDLSRIAVGIFFLGVQIFHLSLVIVVIAKFQEIRERKKPIRIEQAEGAVIAPDGSHIMYPTVQRSVVHQHSSPRQYAVGGPPPSAYNTYAGRPQAADNGPPMVTIPRVQLDNPYGTYGRERL